MTKKYLFFLTCFCYLSFNAGGVLALPDASNAEVVELPAVTVEVEAKEAATNKIEDVVLGPAWKVISFVISTLLSVLGVVFYFLAKLLQAKTGSEKLGQITERVGSVLERSVKAVWQVYAKEIVKGKEDGKLTDEEKLKAREMAIDFAKSYLGPKGIQELLWITGIEVDSLDGTLGKMLEPYVLDFKNTHKIMFSENP